MGGQASSERWLDAHRVKGSRSAKVIWLNARSAYSALVMGKMPSPLLMGSGSHMVELAKSMPGEALGRERRRGRRGAGMRGGEVGKKGHGRTPHTPHQVPPLPVFGGRACDDVSAVVLQHTNTKCASWGTMCSHELWAPTPGRTSSERSPSSAAGTPSCRNTSILAPLFIIAPRSDALEKLSFVLVGCLSSVLRRVESEICEHRGTVTAKLRPHTTHVVIWPNTGCPDEANLLAACPALVESAPGSRATSSSAPPEVKPVDAPTSAAGPKATPKVHPFFANVAKGRVNVTNASRATTSSNSGSGSKLSAAAGALGPATSMRRDAPTGLGWHEARQHPEVKAGLSEGRKTRGGEGRRYIRAVHPGFILECIRHGTRVPDAPFNLEEIIAPSV